jgi:hypothetical protein
MVNWEEVGFGCGGCDSTLGRDRQLHIASDWCSSASALHLRATSTAKDVGLCAERDLAAAKATIGAGFAKDITPADWAWFKDHAALIDALVNRVPTFTKPPASSQYAAIRTKCTDLMQAVKEADLTSAIPSQSRSARLDEGAFILHRCGKRLPRRDPQSRSTIVGTGRTGSKNGRELAVAPRIRETTSSI